MTVTTVDAFTDRPFAGNPAAVVVLDEAAPEGWMRALAAEMNLSETAFLTPAEPAPVEIALDLDRVAAGTSAGGAVRLDWPGLDLPDNWSAALLDRRTACANRSAEAA